MGASGDLRHDAAIGCVLLPLRSDNVGQDPAAPGGVPGDDRGGGFIAAGLDAKDVGVAGEWFAAGKRPKTRAVRVGWPWNKQSGNIYVPGWYFSGSFDSFATMSARSFEWTTTPSRP